MSHDTLLHRAVRPLVVVLARTRVTPDVVTSLRLATGLCAAGCCAVARGPWLGVGAGLFLVSLLLDRADGALARRTGCYSRVGPLFDLASDCVSTMALFLGLGFGLGSLGGALTSTSGPLLGLIAAVSVAVTFLLLNRPEMAGPAEVSRLVDPDDAMLLVPLAIWAGHADWVLYLAGSLTPFTAIMLTGIVRGRRRRGRVARLALARPVK